MRAFVLPGFGETPEVRDVPRPDPGPGEVLVAVHAASVNGFDLAVANGYLEGGMEHRFPVVLGKDFAGVIESLGQGVEDYAVGDRVFGVVSKAYLGDGSFGQYVAVPTAVGLAHLPAEISFEEAATLGLAGTAAVDSVDAAGIATGSVVLVAGATGGVGSYAVQLAAGAGARVIATAHTPSEGDHVHSLGADEHVDFTGDIPEQVRAAFPEGVDVVLHFAGDPVPLGSVLKPGGAFVSTLAQHADQVGAPQATFTSVFALPTTQTLGRLADDRGQGRTRVTIERRYDLEDAPEAFADFARGTVGKLVVTVA